MNTGLLFSSPFYVVLRKNILKTSTLSFLPALLWTIFIFILLIIPGSDLPTASFLDLIYFDKWVHVGLFAVMTFLWSFPFFKTLKGNHFLFAFIGFSSDLYGAAMEFVQKYFASGRSFDLIDIIADTTGCLTGFLFTVYLYKRQKLKVR